MSAVRPLVDVVGRPAKQETDLGDSRSIYHHAVLAAREDLGTHGTDGVVADQLAFAFIVSVAVRQTEGHVLVVRRAR